MKMDNDTLTEKIPFHCRAYFLYTSIRQAKWGMKWWSTMVPHYQHSFFPAAPFFRWALIESFETTDWGAQIEIISWISQLI